MNDMIARALAIKALNKQIQPEEVQQAVEGYFEEHPIPIGATEEQVAQINANTEALTKKMEYFRVEARYMNPDWKIYHGDEEMTYDALKE